MITIETADRPGLLVDIAKVFFKKDMSIFSSRINTLGDKVEDTFEIEGKNKAKISTIKINVILLCWFRISNDDYSCSNL